MRSLRNTALSGVVTGSRVLSVAVVMLWVARELGPAGFGSFTYALTLATVLAVIPDYGFSLQLVARITRTPGHTRQLLRAASWAKGCLAFVAVLGGVGWALIYRPPSDVLRISVVLFVAAMALSFGQLHSYVFRGNDRFEFDAITSAIQNFALVIGVLVVYLVDGGPMGIACAYLAARLLYLAITSGLLRRQARDTDSAPGLTAFSMLREGFPYGVHTALGVLCLNLDSLILAAYQDNTTVGHYQAGMRLVFASALLPEVLTSGLFPTLARAFGIGESEQAVRVGRMMHRYLLLFGGLAAAIFLVAPVLIRRLLFGASYAALDTLLPWFGLVIFLRYASTTYGAAITAVGAQRSRTLALLGAAALSLAADFWLIPRFGLRGALAASVSTQLVILLLYAGLTRRHVGGWLIDQRAATGLAVLALMGGFAWRLSTVAPHVVAILGPVVLAASTVALAIPSTEWQRLRQAIRGAPAAATYGT